MKFWAALGFALLVAGGTPPTAAGEDDLPKKTALQPVKPRRGKSPKPLQRLYLLPAERTPVETPSVLRAKVEGEVLLLADVDGDGRYDEPDIDGWCLLDDTHLLPVTDPLVFGSRLLRLRAAPEEKKLYYGVEEIDAPPRVLACLAELNARRRQNGLPTAGIDPELSAGCLLHAQYCDRWGQQHEEDASKAGYTPEGAAAGMAASIGATVERMPVIYAQFFHRFSITEPDTAAFGLAQSQSHALVDGMRGKRKLAFTWPVAIPADKSENQPLAFDTSERPAAYPDGSSPGFPITLQFPDFRTFADVDAHLHTLEKPKSAIDIWVSWPGKPANARFPMNYRAISVIPHHRLRPNTTYEVVIRYAGDPEPIEHRWTFTTARR